MIDKVKKLSKYLSDSQKNIFLFFSNWYQGLLLQWLSSFYIAVISFCLSIFLARKLGVESFGTYSYILSLVGILMIIQDAGYKTLLFRERVSMPVSDLLSRGIGHLIFFTIFFGLIIIVIKPQNWLIILSALFCMSLIVLSNFVSSLMKGCGRFNMDAIWKMTIRTLSGVSIISVLLFYETTPIHMLFVGWGLAIFVALLWPIANGWLVWPKFIFQSDFFRANIAFLTIDFATIIYFRSDIILLNYLGIESTDVGQYAAAYRILEGIILITTPVAMMSFRALRTLNNNQMEFIRLFRLLLFLMILASILIIIFGLIWGGEFMLFLFGAEYKTAGLLLFWLLFSILFILPNYILTQASIALDREVSYAKIVIFVALLNIVLNIFLIPEFGAVGAAWSTIVAEGFLCLNLCWIMRSRLRGID